MGILDEILATKRDEVTMLRRPDVADLLRARALEAGSPRDFVGALRRPDGRLAVIAELKRRSPSKGELAPDLDPAAHAAAYEQGGAAALSVLTDQPYFGGEAADVEAARAATALPALRKDFTIDEIQIYESLAIGADAVLLIVAAIPDGALLADLHSLALDLGLGVLVEAHDEQEVERAVAVGAAVVGVTSRNLQTFDEDLSVGERLAKLIPPDVVAVGESAVRSSDDAFRMGRAGFDAILVGEAFVRSDQPTSTVAEFAAAPVTPRR